MLYPSQFTNINDLLALKKGQIYRKLQETLKDEKLINYSWQLLCDSREDIFFDKIIYIGGDHTCFCTFCDVARWELDKIKLPKKMIEAKYEAD